MTKNDDWKAVLINGVVYEKRADGTLAPVPERMDWDRIDAITEDDLARFMAEDGEDLEARHDDWAKAVETRRLRLAKAAEKQKRA